MADHLPECDATDCGCEDGEECGPRCRHFCICNQLTAAEQRGRTQGEKEAGQALAAAVWDNPQAAVLARVTVFDDGVIAGVKAARDAVAAHIRADLTGQEMFCGRKRGILAAIDALEKP